MRFALAALLVLAACKKAAPTEPPPSELGDEPRVDPSTGRTATQERAIEEAAKAREEAFDRSAALARGTARLDDLEALVPAKGVLVHECGLAAQGPQCVRVIFDADTHVVTYQPWQPSGGTTEKTLDLGAARAAELWARAAKVLEPGHLTASNVSDFTLHLAVRESATRSEAVEVNGPFKHPETAALVDELIALAK